MTKCCVVDVCTNCGFIKIGLRLGHGVVGRERWADHGSSFIIFSSE